MIRIRKTLAFAALALALSTAVEAQAQSSTLPSIQAGMGRWRGSRNEQMINQAVRYYGFRPNRLTNAQVDAIQETWYELFGPGARRALSRTQATAIVYMALVHPREEDGMYEDGRPGRPGGGWNRPGGGYDDPPPYRGEACVQMEADAYRLENLVVSGNSIFLADADRGRARTLARQIQQNAVECRASAVADRVSDVLAALATQLPTRSDVQARVNALKEAIRHSGRGGRR